MEFKFIQIGGVNKLRTHFNITIKIRIIYFSTYNMYLTVGKNKFSN